MPLSPEQDNSGAVTHPSVPAPCRGMGPGGYCWYEYRWDIELWEELWLDPGMLQLLPDSWQLAHTLHARRGHWSDASVPGQQPPPHVWHPQDVGH